MQSVPIGGCFFRLLGFVALLMLWSGCSIRPLQQHFGELGRIEAHTGASAGLVIGVPRGVSESAALDYADSIRQRTGAGMVVAYGFGAKRVPVTQPLVRSAPARERGSIYREFKSSLRSAAGGAIRFYIGLRMHDSKRASDRIEIASTGLSLQQLRALKENFLRRREHVRGETETVTIDVAIEPLDEIGWDSTGSKHHGVLLAAERGLSLRLPARLASGAAKTAYRRIISDWIADAVEMAAQDSPETARIDVVMLPHGKIELIHAAKEISGVVIGAPHGTFDAYTGGLVRRFCASTGLAGVVATGFTPTESGDGWRINVNRPSERHATLTLSEAETVRSLKTYEQFKKSVLAAARGRLNLYIDIHQNSGWRIEVATVGVTPQEARFIKDTYYTLRSHALAGRADMASVELAIEPLDELEVGAWPAKETGILRAARKSLHFELPADGMMASEKHRNLYALVLTQLLHKIAPAIAAEHNHEAGTAAFPAISR